MSTVRSIHDIVTGNLAAGISINGIIADLEEREDAIAGRIYDLLTSQDLAPESGEVVHIIARAFQGEPEPDDLDVAVQNLQAAAEAMEKASEHYRDVSDRFRHVLHMSQVKQ